MFEGTNLIDLPDTQMNKFITACMNICFTPDEQANGIVLKPNQPTTSKRQPLDMKRYDLIKCRHTLSNSRSAFI
jgi:hypothetical protein